MLSAYRNFNGLETSKQRPRPCVCRACRGTVFIHHSCNIIMQRSDFSQEGWRDWPFLRSGCFAFTESLVRWYHGIRHAPSLEITLWRSFAICSICKQSHQLRDAYSQGAGQGRRTVSRAHRCASSIVAARSHAAAHVV